MGKDAKNDPTEGVVTATPGPVVDRKCTDVFFLLLFILFWGGMFVIAGIAFSNGDARRLYMPSDVYGNFCGLDNTVIQSGVIYDFDTAVSNPQSSTDSNCNLRQSDGLTTTMRQNCDMRMNLQSYPYLVYIDPVNNIGLGGFCASSCPSQTSSVITCPDPSSAGYNSHRPGRTTVALTSGNVTTSTCSYARVSVWCNSGCSNSYVNTSLPSSGYTVTQVQALSGDYVIAGTEYPGSPFVFRCIPSSSLNSKANSAAGSIGDKWGQMWGDVARCWKIFALCSCTAFIFGFLWLILTKWLAGGIVWLSIIAVLALLIVVAYVATTRAKEQQSSNPSGTNSQDTDALLYTGYAFYGLAFIYLCVIIYLRNRINLAISIIKEASTAVEHMPAMIFLPLFFVVALLCIFVYWIAVALYLMSIFSASVGMGTINGGTFDRPTQLSWSFNTSMRYVLIYHFFGLLWTLGFVLALLFLTIAIAVATWYFIEYPKTSLPRAPVAGAFAAAFKNHLGSLAFGSLIIAIIEFIRFVILYFEKKIRAMTKDGPCIVRCCVGCLICYCNCCMWCVQKFMEFISNNAYVQIAINGYPFCRAAKNAWNLVMANLVRIGTVNFVADFLCFCGKLVIVLANCIVALYLTKSDTFVDGGAQNLSSPVLIVLLVFIITWFIAQLFMNVYESAIVALMQCFLVDEKDYGGKFCSENLHKFINSDVQSKQGKEDGKTQKLADARAGKKK